MRFQKYRPKTFVHLLFFKLNQSNEENLFWVCFSSKTKKCAFLGVKKLIFCITVLAVKSQKAQLCLVKMLKIHDATLA